MSPQAGYARQNRRGNQSGSAEGSVGYGARSGAYAQAEAVKNLVEDRPPEAAAASAAAEAVKSEAEARPGYDFEPKQKAADRKSEAYAQVEAAKNMVEDRSPEAAAAAPAQEKSASDSGARPGYDFEPQRKSYNRPIGHRPQYQGGNRAKKSGSEYGHVGYLEGLRAQGRADFAASWMGALPLEAAIDTMVREELEAEPEARRRYQLEQKRQTFALAGHRNMRVKPNSAEKYLPRYTKEEFVAMGLVKSVEEIPFKLEADERMSRARFLVYMSANQIYNDNKGKAQKMKPGLLAEAAKMAGTFAYTEIPNPLNYLGGAKGVRAGGGLIKKTLVGAATAGSTDFGAGAVGKSQAERWGVETSWGEVTDSALTSAGLGAGFTVVGLAAQAVMKGVGRALKARKALRKPSGSAEMGPAYGSNSHAAPDKPGVTAGDRLDAPAGIGNNEFKGIGNPDQPPASKTGSAQYSVRADEPIDNVKVDFTYNRSGYHGIVVHSDSGALHSIALSNGHDRELLRSFGQEELAKTIRATHNLGQATKSELADLNVKSKKNRVVAHSEVDGLNDFAKGYNPAAKVDGHARGEKGQPLFFERNSKRDVNVDMYSADAEIRILQGMYERFPNGELNGKNVRMSVAGRRVCDECIQDIPAAADALGLNSIMIYEENMGRWLYWCRGMPNNCVVVLGKPK